MNDQQLYKVVKKIADMVHENVSDDLTMDDWRNTDPNPFEKQTSQGLFLEMYYDLPNRLWTPWGTWHFGGSGGGPWRELHSQILTKLGATEYQPVRHGKIGVIGPVYAIHEFNDQALPEPIERNRNEYIDDETAKSKWKGMKLFHETE